MQIVTDSKKVLQEIYKLLNEDSHSLVVNVSIDSIAEKLNMSKQHLNLCIHYLIESNYLRGDFCFDNSKNSNKEIYVLPLAVNHCENSNL